MKTLYSKWTKEEYKVAEVTYKTHFKRTKTVEAKIRRYEKSHIPYFLTTNALENEKVQWTTRNFTYEGMDERVFDKEEELFIDSAGWVIQKGKLLRYNNGKSIHIKNLLPELWATKNRK
jgi:hypothetical protein